jgi:hypothetical protein
VAGADLIGLWLTEQSDEVMTICAQVRGQVGRNLDYILRLKAFGPAGLITHQAGQDRLKNLGLRRRQTKLDIADILKNGSYFCNQVSLAELGYPDFVFVSAEVRGLEVDLIDQTAWQLVSFE